MTCMRMYVGTPPPIPIARGRPLPSPFLFLLTRGVALVTSRQTQRATLVQRSSAALARGPCVGGFGESMPGSPAPLQSPVDGAGDPAVCATESIGTRRKRGKGRVTTPTAAGGSMASRHRRHGLPSTRIKIEGLHLTHPSHAIRACTAATNDDIFSTQYAAVSGPNSDARTVPRE